MGEMCTTMMKIQTILDTLDPHHLSGLSLTDIPPVCSKFVDSTEEAKARPQGLLRAAPTNTCLKFLEGTRAWTGLENASSTSERTDSQRPD